MHGTMEEELGTVFIRNSEECNNNIKHNNNRVMHYTVIKITKYVVYLYSRHQL
jgi:hypothetical protein